MAFYLHEALLVCHLWKAAALLHPLNVVLAQQVQWAIVKTLWKRPWRTHTDCKTAQDSTWYFNHDPACVYITGCITQISFQMFFVPFLSRNSSTLHLGWHQIRVHWTPLLVFLCRQNPGKGWRICCWMTAVKCWNHSGGRVFFYSTIDFNVFYKARQMQTQCPAQHIWSTHHGH